MNKYYFLVCSLPSIQIGVKPELSSEELKNYLQWSLTEKDKKILYDFKQYVDIKNFKNIWLNKEIDLRGNFDEKKLNEFFFIEEYFPEAVFEFFKKFETEEEKIENFSLLELDFLNYQMQTTKNEFLKSFYSLQRDVKLVLAALRAKWSGRDISQDLAINSQDKKESLLENILLQKDMESYDPPKEYEELKHIFLNATEKESPMVFYENILKYFFQKCQELSEKKPFTIDQILGYLAALMLAEDYYHLNSEFIKEKAKSALDSFL